MSTTAEHGTQDVYMSFERNLPFDPIDHPSFEHSVFGLGLILQYNHPFVVTDTETRPETAAAVNAQLRVSYDPETGFSFEQLDTDRDWDEDWTIEAAFVVTRQHAPQTVIITPVIFAEILDTHGKTLPAEDSLEAGFTYQSLTRVEPDPYWDMPYWDMRVETEDGAETLPWEARDWGTLQYGVDLGMNPMSEAVVDMCGRLLIENPDPNALTTCPGHRAMVWNPQAAPKWIIDETAGRGLYRSDMGWPGIARFWDYINWGRLLRDHDDLVVDGLGSSQFRPLTLEMIDICAELREQGFCAALDVDLEVEAVANGRPIFGLSAMGLQVHNVNLESHLPVDTDVITQRLLPPSIEASNEIYFHTERDSLHWTF